MSCPTCNALGRVCSECQVAPAHAQCNRSFSALVAERGRLVAELVVAKVDLCAQATEGP